jgi:S-adenosyl methyltransferase
MDALPPGSYLTISDTTRDIDADRVAGAASRLNAGMGPTRLTLRTREEILGFFGGLDLVDPGLVPLPRWRAVADAATPNSRLRRPRPQGLTAGPQGLTGTGPDRHWA